MISQGLRRKSFKQLSVIHYSAVKCPELVLVIPIGRHSHQFVSGNKIQVFISPWVPLQVIFHVVPALVAGHGSL